MVASRGSSKLFERIISGIALVVITATSLWLGGFYLFTIFLLISLIGMMELFRIKSMHKNIIGIIGYLTAFAYYLSIYYGDKQYDLLILLSGLILMMSIYVIRFPKYNAESVMLVFFGISYVAIMLSYIYQIRIMENGLYIVWLPFICSWGNDTFAYFSGVLLGKHKMAPRLSPKKSIEGAIGGILGAAILGAAYGFIMSQKLTAVSNPIFVFSLASVIGAILSIVGDLAASAIKRNFNMKDYGKLIPGHGGILDRYDSVIFTAPVVFWVVYFFDHH